MDSAAKTQRTLVVASSVDPVVPLLLQQFGMACRNAKLALDTFDLEANQPNPDLHRYSSILLVCPQAISLHQDFLRLLEAYVRSGGGLVVVNPQEDSSIGRLCGIKEFRPRPDNKIRIAQPVTITFLVDLFPAVVGLTQDLMLADVGICHILDDTAQLELVASGSSNLSLAWRRRYGAGMVFVWNISLTAVEWGRAWLLQSILTVQEIAVRGIANVGMVQVDDFPAPFVNRACEPVQSEFDMPVLEFLDKVWLPDMLQIADKYGIRYSFALPFNYNATTEAPFGFAEWDAETICGGGEVIAYGVYFAKKIRDKHELCLHGYNHIPLCIENWGSRQAMINSLRAALSKWSADGLGPMPSAYVAPMNQYDRDGVLALMECLPSLKVICAERSNNRELGGRQFEMEPWNKKIFCLPRITYGYKLTESLMFDMISTIAELGVWTHCLHPDDIFEIHDNPNLDFPARNERYSGWRDSSNGALKDELENWFEFAAKNFPWLRYMNATQTGEQIRSHLSNSLEVVFDDDQIELRSEIPAFIQLRVTRQRGEASQKILEVTDQSAITVLDHYQGATYSLYTLEIPAGTSTAHLRKPLKIN